jgi:hypothetical protein
LLHRCGDRFEDLIADAVTEAVVDELEPVTSSMRSARRWSERSARFVSASAACRNAAD